MHTRPCTPKMLNLSTIFLVLSSSSTCSRTNQLVDQLGNMLFMLVDVFENGQRARPLGRDGVDRADLHLAAALNGIVDQLVGVFELLGSLFFHPVGAAVEALVHEMDGHRKVEVRRPHLGLDLCVERIG